MKSRKIKDKTFEEMQSKYGDMVMSMPRAEDQPNRKPAFKTPSQAQAMHDGLKREGMIADIKANDLSTNCSDLMEIDNEIDNG
jgi:hypothetical protein